MKIELLLRTIDSTPLTEVPTWDELTALVFFTLCGFIGLVLVIKMFD